MASVLQQLDDKQAVLLMYVADELTPDDRAEVERMLAVDADLRAELERLRDASAWFADQMRRSDRFARPTVPEYAAVRRVGRAMRQWHARRLAAAPAGPAARTLRYPWWAYPLAAAASVVIAFLVWWGNTERTNLAQRDRGMAPQAYEETQPQPPDAALIEEFRGEMIARSLGFGDFSPDAFTGGPPSEWDEFGSLYAAVDPSDANVLMLPNPDDDPADEKDGAPDNDPRT